MPIVSVVSSDFSRGELRRIVWVKELSHSERARNKGTRFGFSFAERGNPSLLLRLSWTRFRFVFRFGFLFGLFIVFRFFFHAAPMG